MTIDVSALKQFEKTFGPVLQAIPAIIDSLNAEADLDRAIAAKRSEFAALLKQIDDAKAEQKDRVDAAARMVKQEQDRLAELKKASRQEREAAAAAANLAAQEKAELTGALQAEQDGVRRALLNLKNEYAAKRDELERDMAARRAELEADVNLLVNRKDAAAAALEAIRAKLG